MVAALGYLPSRWHLTRLEKRPPDAGAHVLVTVWEIFQSCFTGDEPLGERIGTLVGTLFLAALTAITCSILLLFAAIAANVSWVVVAKLVILIVAVVRIACDGGCCLLRRGETPAQSATPATPGPREQPPLPRRMRGHAAMVDAQSIATLYARARMLEVNERQQEVIARMAQRNLRLGSTPHLPDGERARLVRQIAEDARLLEQMQRQHTEAMQHTLTAQYTHMRSFGQRLDATWLGVGWRIERCAESLRPHRGKVLAALIVAGVAVFRLVMPGH